jgi:hypothetical protein
MPAAKSSGKKTRARNKIPQPPHTPAPSLADRIETERDRIGRAVSIIHVCCHATASLYNNDDPESMRDALIAANDILGKSDEAFEVIARDAAEGGAR